MDISQPLAEFPWWLLIEAKPKPHPVMAKALRTAGLHPTRQPWLVPASGSSHTGLIKTENMGVISILLPQFMSSILASITLAAPHWETKGRMGLALEKTHLRCWKNKSLHASLIVGIEVAAGFIWRATFICLINLFIDSVCIEHFTTPIVYISS